MLLTELPRTGAIQILAAGFTRVDHAARGKAASLRDLTLQSDAVLVYDARHTAEIGESVAALLEEIPETERAFIALVPRVPAPAVDSDYGEPISSFACSADVFLQFLGLGIEFAPSPMATLKWTASWCGRFLSCSALLRQQSQPRLKRWCCRIVEARRFCAHRSNKSLARQAVL